MQYYRQKVATNNRLSLSYLVILDLTHSLLNLILYYYRIDIRYDGSLKAEHGTGRNIAPFVELEWGSELYQVMWKVKEIFDPKGILNPGVLLNDDPSIHLKNIKPMPASNPIIDKCIGKIYY